ncbi:MAG: glycosyltransferase family 2 protein [Desulfamplus sp.]|nr:glycosyltransferase family 2 protein [Desulfamplus sp.]
MVQHIHALNSTLQQPVCSICIANFNGRNTLAACLDSILQQTFDLPIEIIVHDDASTDDSVPYLLENYPNIELLISKQNCGFCVSNNRMVDIARGEFILLLNNDAALYPDALKTLYDYASKQPVKGILGLPQYDIQTGELIDIGEFFDPFLNPLPNLEYASQSVGMIIGACLWLPRTLWVELGGFPDWFHTLAEDMFLCCYARLKGYPVEAVAISGFRHLVGKSLGGGKVVNNRLSTSFKRRALSERNRLYVMAMCYPSPFVWIILPLHIVLLLIEGCMLALLKKDAKILDSIYLSACKAFWQNHKKLFKLRCEIQRKRKISYKDFFSTFSILPYKVKMLIKHGLPEIT